MKKRWAVFFIFFSLTIINFGVIPLGLSLLGISSCAYFLIATSLKKVNVKPLVITLFLPLFFIVYSIITIFFYQDNVKLVMYVAILVYIFAVIVSVFGLYHSDRGSLEKGISIYIYMSFFVVFLQHIFYLATKEYLDIHQVLTIFRAESRHFNALLFRFGLSRPTGWTVEPSNMSAIMVFISVLYYRVKGGIDRVFFLGMLTSLLTFSFAGILITAGILFIVSFNYLSKAKLVFLSTPFVLLLFYFVYYRLTGNVDYDSLGMRLDIIDVIFNQNVTNFIFGNGFFALSEPLNIQGVLVHDHNIRDSGVWVNLIFSVGIFATLIILLTMIVCCDGLDNFFIYILALSSKFDYFQPFFWLFIILLMVSKTYERKNHRS